MRRAGRYPLWGGVLLHPFRSDVDAPNGIVAAVNAPFNDLHPGNAVLMHRDEIAATWCAR